MNEYIHILKGTGNNCSCGDCSVLYGGECYTTPINNFLDILEKAVINNLKFTPTGKIKKISNYQIDSCIETVVRPLFKKYKNIKDTRFYDYFYNFLPLIFILTSNEKEARGFYRRSRMQIFMSICNDYDK